MTDVRDESDRDGMRVVVEMKRGTDPVTVLNGLYHNTRLRSRFACNFVALVNGTPLTLALKDFLSHFLDFRCACLVKPMSIPVICHRAGNA